MTQGIGSDSDGVNLSIALANRSKRSLAINLRSERGRQILDRLIATADVFLTNFRPDAVERMRLDPASLTEEYPGLVYARGTGYGTRARRQHQLATTPPLSGRAVPLAIP